MTINTIMPFQEFKLKILRFINKIIEAIKRKIEEIIIPFDEKAPNFRNGIKNIEYTGGKILMAFSLQSSI